MSKTSETTSRGRQRSKPAAWACSEKGCGNTAPSQPLDATPMCMNTALHKNKKIKPMVREKV